MYTIVVLLWIWSIFQTENTEETKLWYPAEHFYVKCIGRQTENVSNSMGYVALKGFSFNKLPEEYAYVY